MNSAVVEKTQGGVTTTVKSTPLDPLQRLYTPGKGPYARVAMTVGTQHNFGEVKVSVTVSLECDQSTTAIDDAGMQAFEKATSFMNDAMQLLTSGGQ